MSSPKTLFQNYIILDSPSIIVLKDNSSHSAIVLGSILLHLPTEQTLFILDVLCISGLAKNLLSVAFITQTGNTTITFTHTQCIIATKSSNSRKQTQYQLNKNSNLFTLGIGVELILI